MVDDRVWWGRLLGEYRATYRDLGNVSERLAEGEDQVAALEHIGSMRRDVAWAIGRLRREGGPVGTDELAILSQRQRAVYLAHRGGLTYGQIGILLSLSRGAVERHLLRARQKLQGDAERMERSRIRQADPGS